MRVHARASLNTPELVGISGSLVGVHIVLGDIDRQVELEVSVPDTENLQQDPL